MQPHDTSDAEGNKHTRRRTAPEQRAERSAPQRPTTAHTAGVRRAEVLDSMFDAAAAEDTELLERLAQ